MKTKKITMVLKRVQYQTIEVTESNGYDMPENANDLISMVENLKSNSLHYTKEEEWDEPGIENIEIISFDVQD